MTGEYRIDLKTPAGIKVAELTGTDGYGFLSLAYSKRVNEPGVASFSLDGSSPALSLLQRKGQVEIWRRNRALGIPWTSDFRGFYLGQKYQTREYDTALLTCPGIMTALSWRHVAYRAATANRSAFTSAKAETVMKTLFNYNIGSSATVLNGRERSGVISGFSAAPDLARGTTLDWNCAWDNLLTTIQQLATIAGGDFDLNQTGANTYSFEYYPTQRGTDRRDTLTFSLGFGNMAEPVYTLDYTNTKTVAIVGGEGREADRAITIVPGSDYAVDWDIETFVNAQSAKTINARTAEGNAALVNKRTKERLSYSVLQTSASAYGRDYFLGDIATGRYGLATVIQKIKGVSVSLDGASGEEDIDVELETI